VQTFFREKRHIRYFIVQEPEKQIHQLREREERSQASKQQRKEKEDIESCQQRLASLTYEWETAEQRDREAIECIAEQASAKDRTGWFKRTRWDEHLQAYPDWRLLSYAIRIPADDEPRLQRVVQLVEELVEEAVQGLSTLSIDTLRWLRSPRPQEIDIRPFGRLQNQTSQLRAARL